MHVVVIGGGAAGMISAIAAAKQGAKVTLFEKNEKLGKKLYITGKGRCNVTNASPVEDLFDAVITNAKFLYSSFYTFDNLALMALLEEYGCPLKEERGKRVFPVSDHSSDVISALRSALRALDVDVLLGKEVKDLLVADGCCNGVYLSKKEMIPADAVICCTGGISYASTGSTGDGYRFAKEQGHSIVTPVPALAPLCCAESWCRDLMGLSLKNVSLSMVCGKKKLFEEQGEMLFTHFGVSGPLVLSASSHYGKRKSQEVKLYIDLKPALSKEQLDKRILRDFDDEKNRNFSNSLNGLLPTKLIPVVIGLAEIPPDKKVNEITKEERQRLVELLKALPLHVTGTGSFDEAIITQGGIKVKEINPSTMESKLVQGLYFAGEVLDLDAVTGGYNLQIAWSTGYLAGLSAAQKGEDNEF